VSRVSFSRIDTVMHILSRDRYEFTIYRVQQSSARALAISTLTNRLMRSYPHTGIYSELGRYVDFSTLLLGVTVGRGARAAVIAPNIIAVALADTGIV